MPWGRRQGWPRPLPSLSSGEAAGAVPSHSRRFSCFFSPENVFMLLDLAGTGALGGKQMTPSWRLRRGRSRHSPAAGVRRTTPEGWCVWAQRAHRSMGTLGWRAHEAGGHMRLVGTRGWRAHEAGGHTRLVGTWRLAALFTSVVAQGGAVDGLVLLDGDVSPGLFGATLGGRTPQKHLPSTPCTPGPCGGRVTGWSLWTTLVMAKVTTGTGGWAGAAPLSAVSSPGSPQLLS